MILSYLTGKKEYDKLKILYFFKDKYMLGGKLIQDEPINEGIMLIGYMIIAGGIWGILCFIIVIFIIIALLKYIFGKKKVIIKYIEKPIYIEKDNKDLKENIIKEETIEKVEEQKILDENEYEKERNKIVKEFKPKEKYGKVTEKSLDELW